MNQNNEHQEVPSKFVVVPARIIQFIDSDKCLNEFKNNNSTRKKKKKTKNKRPCELEMPKLRAPEMDDSVFVRKEVSSNN